MIAEPVFVVRRWVSRSEGNDHKDTKPQRIHRRFLGRHNEALKFFTPELYEFTQVAWHADPEDEEWGLAWAAACQRLGMGVDEVNERLHAVRNSRLDPHTALGLQV